MSTARDWKATLASWRADAAAKATAFARRAQTAAHRTPWKKVGLTVSGGLAALVLTVLLVLTFIDWNVLRGPISSFASATLQRRVEIAGDLDVDPWSLHPRFTARNVTVAGPAWAAARDTIAVSELSGRVQLLPLLRGDWRFDEIDLKQPVFYFLREASGRASWRFREAGGDKPAKFPPIKRLDIQDGALRIEDGKRKLVFDGALQTTQSESRAFQLSGEGKLNGENFRAVIAGPPLDNVDRARPYAFTADIVSGATRLRAEGAIDRPFDLSAFSARLDSAGPDLADLYPLVGVAFPNTPPYRLRANLRRDGQVYRVTAITGVVGDTDLAGAMTADRTGPRMLLTADLSSRALDFDDLAVVLGGVPDRGAGETASVAQRAAGERMAAMGRLLPNAKLDLDRVRNMDARLKYRARSVKTRFLPLTQFAVDLSLQQGVLVGNPVSFRLPNGAITGVARIDARRDTPDVNVDFRLAGGRLEDFTARSPQPDAITGPLQARVTLHGRGRSVHDAASNADGQVTVVARNGEVRAAFAELLGVNVTRGLGLLLTGDRSTTPLRCAVAGFEARDGVLHARALVVDTGVVLALGKGQINLADETIDLELRGQPKEARLLRLMAPINVGGSLARPKFGVDLKAAAGQAGLGAALASVLAPVASILPFVGVDLAEDADCRTVVAQARNP